MEFSKDRKDQTSIFLPEKVVPEILLRLPVRDLFRFTCVSKQWYYIISDPKFALAYRRRQARSSPKSLHLWELLYQDKDQVYIERHLLNQAEVLNINHAEQRPFISCIVRGNVQNKKTKGMFDMASSNGLILSSSCNPTCNWLYHIGKLEFCVSNPFTGRSVWLPSLSSPFTKLAYGFVTGRRLHGANVTYKVVVIQRVKGRLNVDGSTNCTIEIFSSDTGIWSGKQFHSCPLVVFEWSGGKAFNCNGVLHWFDKNARSIVTYDPYGSPDRFGRIQYPKGTNKVSVSLIQWDEEDVLRYGEIEIGPNVNDRCFRVWRLVDYAKGEWCMEKMCLIVPKYYTRALSPVFSTLKFLGLSFQGSTSDSDDSEDMAFPVNMACMSTVVPVAYCPWSSPLYRNALNDIPLK